MPKVRKLHSDAAEVCRLHLMIARSISHALFKSNKYGSNADDVVLCCAVFIGQVEGRPMTAGKVADYVGIPRPTVVRKLRALVQAGVVTAGCRGRFSLSNDVLALDAVADSIVSNIRLIHSAAGKLSKMDG